jgi:glutamyl-tRNA synthetase
MTVRTRFAPSPTGYLHIGGVRTALFNWLFARKHGGQFLLRVDDTDAERNVAAALEPILHGFKWLGLDWDEGPQVDGPHAPYYQSQRGEKYRAAAEQLVASGHAYRDFATTEEIQAERVAAQGSGAQFTYSRRWMAETDADAERFAAEGRQAVVRLKMPREGELVINDLVRGEVRFPLAAEPGSKNKLSKRKLDKYLKNKDFATLKDHGQRIADRLGLTTSADTFNPVIVDFYEQIGFLPDAILNYLLLLGWSLDDKTEQFTRTEMIEHFSLERVNKATASFDPQKLFAFQDRDMQQLPIKQKVAFVLPFLQQAGFVASPPPCDTAPYLSKIVEAAGDRIKVGGDILDYDDFYTADDKLTYDEKTLDKRLKNATGAVELLTEFRGVLAQLDPFDAATTETALKSFVEQKDIKIGDIVHAVRVAVTGKGVGFGLFETLAILGRERCLARIDRALTMVK